MTAGEQHPGRAGRARPPLLRIAMAAVSVAAVAAFAVIGLTRPDGHGGAAHLEAGHLADAASGPGGAQAADTGPDPETARQRPDLLAAHLLARVYMAFSEREEAAIYDDLALVAEGEVLEDLYLEKRAALAGAVPGASRATGQAVHAIDILGARYLDGTAPGLADAPRALAARWQVIGTVEHEDHAHLRGNVYAARLAVVRREAGWRLTGFELLEVERAPEAEAEGEPTGEAAGEPTAEAAGESPGEAAGHAAGAAPGRATGPAARESHGAAR